MNWRKMHGVPLLPAIRDRLDVLLEEATRREMNLREPLTWLCSA